MKHLRVLQWLLCRHTLHHFPQRLTSCCCPCVTPSALLLCVSVPREPQGCGGRWPSVHNEKKAGTAAWGAGAHGATAACMTTRVASVAPRLGSAVVVFNTGRRPQNHLISSKQFSLTPFILLRALRADWSSSSPRTWDPSWWMGLCSATSPITFSPVQLPASMFPHLQR